MSELAAAFQEPWAIRALVASLMVGLMCGVLGAFIVLRNMSLIGDALSHAILPGVVVAFILAGHNQLVFFFGSVMAGLICAVTITWIQKNVNTKNDAAIGIVYVLMFSLGVIGISAISRKDGVHIDLKDFLFGDALGVSNEDLYLTAIITIVVVLCVILFYRSLFITTFQESVAKAMGISVTAVHYLLMLLLSFAVVASLRTVGVILVVAMLITPASAAMLLSENLKKVIVISGLIGMLAAFSGLIASILMNTPSGPAMAVMATLFYALAVLFAPRKGVIAKWRIRMAMQFKIMKEDVMKYSLKQDADLKVATLRESLELTRSQVRRLKNHLVAKSLMTQSGEMLALTPSGRIKAQSLVRAHRLWETYLVDKVGLGPDQIHHEAEKIEHHLSEEMIDKVERALGYPHFDPHGSPIPAKSILGRHIFDLEVGARAKISDSQPNQEIIRVLWSRGIQSNEEFAILSKEGESISIKMADGEIFSLTKPLGRNIAVEEIC